MTTIVKYGPGFTETVVREDRDLPQVPPGRVYVYDFGGKLIADLADRVPTD